MPPTSPTLTTQSLAGPESNAIKMSLCILRSAVSVD